MTEPNEKKIGQLTVRIDRSLCIGSANCVKVAGDLFELADEDIAAFAARADAVTKDDVLAFLRDVEKFSYDRIDGELLWAASMPCVVRGETDIPIAAYMGQSARIDQRRPP